jgi:ketosteroid isomerase-like protein
MTSMQTTGVDIEADRVQIRQLIAERETAMRERDAERLVADYAPGAVVFDLAPPLLHSGPEVHDADGLRKWFAGFEGQMHFDVSELAVTVGGEIAFCHSLNRLAATPIGVPDGFELWFRSTVCLNKIDGQWLIAHEHESTPFYMDGSFKAAVDLKP